MRGERPILDDKYDMHKYVNVKYTEDGGAPPYDYAKAVYWQAIFPVFIAMIPKNHRCICEY